MQIEQIEISKIKEYKKNPRKHPIEQINIIMASIREYGFNVPLVIDSKMNLLAGHARLEALKQLKETKAPCIRADLDPKKAKGFIFAENKSYEAGMWDIDLPDLDVLKNMPIEMRDLFSLEINFMENLLDGGATAGELSNNMADRLEDYDKQKYIKLILLIPRKKYLQLEKRAGEKKKTAREYILSIVCKH